MYTVQDVTKYVQGLAGYGEYMIYKRTQNKKTTLRLDFFLNS